MTIQITAVESIPDRPALEALLHNYMSKIVDRFDAIGAPPMTPEGALGDIWQDIDLYLPPKGATLLAHDAAGTLVGCGFIKRIGADAAELKRLYVAPAHRGSGLGRKLVTQRIEIAQEWGVADLYADTVKGNDSMLNLYDGLGFERIDRYAENSNPDHLSPWLCYVHKRLSTPKT